MIETMRTALLHGGRAHDEQPNGCRTRAGQAPSFEEDVLEALRAALQPHLGQLRYPGPTPVGLFNPSPLGCYDLLGNVWEWCDSWLYALDPASSPSLDSDDLRLPVIVKGGPSEQATDRHPVPDEAAGSTRTRDLTMWGSGFTGCRIPNHANSRNEE